MSTMPSLDMNSWKIRGLEALVKTSATRAWEVIGSKRISPAWIFHKPDDNRSPDVWCVHEKQDWQQYAAHSGCHSI